MSVERFRREEMAAPKNHNRCFVQIDFTVRLHLEKIYSNFLLVGAYLAILFGTYLAAYPWALVSARQHSGATLIAGEPAARCSTGQTATPTMFA
jgi:hypothetical protein